MSALSALATRVVAEVNDTSNNTLSASIAGTNFSEVQQYVVDGIRDYRKYVYREALDNSIVTSSSTRSYVVSALSPEPFILKRVEYVQSSTSIHNIPDVELWDGTMYLYDGDKPLYQQADSYFNIFYLSKHDVPSAGSAQITLPEDDEELPVDYAKAKVMEKFALDQRGINQDTSNEFLNMATNFERKYKEGLKQSTTPIVSYKG